MFSSSAAKHSSYERFTIRAKPPHGGSCTVSLAGFRGISASSPSSSTALERL